MGFKHQLDSIDNWKKKDFLDEMQAKFCLFLFACILHIWIMNEQTETVERCKYLYYYFYTYVCIYSLNSILKTKKQRRSNRHTNIVSFVHNLPFSHHRLPPPPSFCLLLEIPRDENTLVQKPFQHGVCVVYII